MQVYTIVGQDENLSRFALQRPIFKQSLGVGMVLRYRVGMAKADAEREERLKAALRSNLARRKEQSRDTAQAVAPDNPHEGGDAGVDTGGSVSASRAHAP